VDGGTNLAAAILLYYFLDPAVTRIDKPVEKSGPADSPYRDKVYLVYIACTILFASCFFQVFSVLPVYYKTMLHMPEYMIGLLMTTNGLLIACFEMVLVFKMEGRRENLVYIFRGAILFGMAYWLLNLLPLSVVTAYVCMFLATAGEITAVPFMASFWIARTKPANRGQYAGLNTMAWSTAQVIGPAGGAEIAQLWGFKTLWWLIGGLFVFAAVGYRWLRKIKSVLDE
jgi:predicted MFS family arabinose efflux permease